MSVACNAKCLKNEQEKRANAKCIQRMIISKKILTNAEHISKDYINYKSIPAIKRAIKEASMRLQVQVELGYVYDPKRER